ncbi:hypothetical protein Tco_0228323 [Tanacetum coccineum]
MPFERSIVDVQLLVLKEAEMKRCASQEAIGEMEAMTIVMQMFDPSICPCNSIYLSKNQERKVRRGNVTLARYRIARMSGSIQLKLIYIEERRLRVPRSMFIFSSLAMVMAEGKDEVRALLLRGTFKGYVGEASVDWYEHNTESYGKGVIQMVSSEDQDGFKEEKRRDATSVWRRRWASSALLQTGERSDQPDDGKTCKLWSLEAREASKAKGGGVTEGCIRNLCPELDSAKMSISCWEFGKGVGLHFWTWGMSPENDLHCLQSKPSRVEDRSFCNTFRLDYPLSEVIEADFCLQDLLSKGAGESPFCVLRRAGQRNWWQMVSFVAGALFIGTGPRYRVGLGWAGCRGAGADSRVWGAACGCNVRIGV